MEDEVLIKFMLKEASPREEAEVKSWIAQSTENQARYEQFELIWNSSKSLNTNNEINVNEAWERFRLKTTNQKNIQLKPTTNYRKWIGIAASIAIISTLIILYNPFKTENYKDLTATTGIITQELPDGSEITLNKNALLSYVEDFNKHRNIKLQSGDVFFRVTPDKSKPFTIEADKVAITVVGTAFNVSKYADQIRVNVESGVVKVSVGHREVELKKGEMVLISNLNPSLVVEKNTDKIYNYYQTGIISARNTNLSELVKILSKAYEQEISVANKTIGLLQITTELPLDATLEHNLKTICETMDLKVQRNAQGIILSNKK